jgi:hypothetical protein
VPHAYLLSVAVCAASCLSLAAAGWLHRLDARARGAEPEPSSIPHGGSSPSRGGLGATLREFRVGLRELPAAFFCLSAMLALGSPLFACFETFAPAVRYKLYISVQTRFGSEPKAELFANQPD